MSNSKPVVSSSQVFNADQPDQAEYQALETALLQTERGRNFLSEYLHRNGSGAILALPQGIEEGAVPPRADNQSSTDTDRILRAVENLHQAVMDNQGHLSADHVRIDILEMAKAIAKTRSEISAMRTEGEDDHLSMASEEMDAIVLSTEKATNDILLAAEKIQEVSWSMREAGGDEAACEEIDNSATDIYMACSFQDLTGQRTTKVVRVLQYLEARIDSMIEIWGMTVQDEKSADEAEKEIIELGSQDERPDAHLLNGPQSQDNALEQGTIDSLLDDESFASIAVDDDPVVLDQSLAMAPIEESISAEEIDEEHLKALFS